MIFRGAVKQFLGGPRRDLSDMKRWCEATVDRKIARLTPRPTFVTEPHLHQKVCFYLSAKLPQNLQLLDMGLGKTKNVLDAFRWRKAAGKLRRLLVLVPNVVNLEGWRMEIAKHAPDLTASYLTGTPVERQDALAAGTDLCLATYAGLVHVVCSRFKDKRGGKMRIDDKKLATAQKLFDGVVWDESTCIMNHLSLSFKIAKRLSVKYEFRVGLTGTPLGRDPMVLWAQFYAVDRGEALGDTIGLFRQAFFYQKAGWFGGVDYTFRPHKTKDLRRLMNHSSIRYSAAECLDLPPKVAVERPFAMTEEQWSYYHAVLEQVKDKASGNKMIDVEGVFVRLRQITSGFVSLSGEPSALAANPKLDALLELVDELPEDAKLVVFNEFIWSGDRITEALKARKVSCARLYSGTRDKQRELRRFMLDPKVRVFVVNSQSGAQGLNLQAAPYVAFYESPVSPIVRQQAEARCHRQGQASTVFVYDLFARNTVDQKVLRFLAEGRDLFKALVEGGIDLLKEER